MKPVKKVKKEEVKIDPKVISRLKNYLGIIIAVFAIALYVQSLKFNYTLDDNTVIKANKVTTKGIKGIPTLLKTDYWYGYDIEVRGPIYRPLSMVMFAIEWQFFPDKPLVGHLMNVILYALSCWLLFILLFELFGRRNLLLPFICALLYVAHPIHTEVVASIKSRDEILCFLFGILSIYTIIKYIEKSSIVLLIVSTICFFLALLSKENSITFLAIMPLVLYFFTNANIKKIAIATSAFIGMAVLFFMIRTYVFSTLHPLSYDSPLNNSILAAPDWIGQKATAIFILFRYVLMMIYPASLSYDYSFAYIPIQKISDPLAMFSILFYLGLLIYAILSIRKKSILAFAILFFMLTISPVSNLFITIGSSMADRFLFIPSLGFCLAISFLLIKLSTKDMNKPKFTNLEQMVSMNAVLFGIIFIVIASFSFKTLARSKDWKDNITLFRHDVKVIDKSARAHYNYGTALFVDIFPKEDNINQKAIILDSAVREYVQALNIFPAYPDAYRNLARCYDLRTEWNNEITTYEMLLKYDRKPDTTVFMNLGILYTKVKEFDKSLSYLDSVIKYNPKIAKAYKNKAFNYLNKKMPNEAIVESMKALELDPNYEKPLSYLGCAYMNLQQYPKAIEYLNKAIEIEPSDVENLKFLATVYSNMGDNKKALELMDKVKSMTGQ